MAKEGGREGGQRGGACEGAAARAARLPPPSVRSTPVVFFLCALLGPLLALSDLPSPSFSLPLRVRLADVSTTLHSSPSHYLPAPFLSLQLCCSLFWSVRNRHTTVATPLPRLPPPCPPRVCRRLLPTNPCIPPPAGDIGWSSALFRLTSRSCAAWRPGGLGYFFASLSSPGVKPPNPDGSTSPSVTGLLHTCCSQPFPCGARAHGSRCSTPSSLATHRATTVTPPSSLSSGCGGRGGGGWGGRGEVRVQ